MNLARIDMDCQNSSGSNGNTTDLSHESEDGTLKVSLRGSVTLSAATAYATRHQEIWSAHTKILWDLRSFDPSGVTSNDILNIRHAFAEIMELRAGGRTALLVSKELELVARVALAICENRDGPIIVRSFLDPAQALQWLEAPDKG